MEPIILKYTNQQAFEQSVKHMAQQKYAARVDGSCAYRTPLGRSCGVGCLITDEQYRADIEGRAIRFLIEDGLVQLSGGVNIQMLEILQSAHDYSHTEEEMVNALDELFQEGIIENTPENIALVDSITFWRDY